MGPGHPRWLHHRIPVIHPILSLDPGTLPEYVSGGPAENLSHLAKMAAVMALIGAMTGGLFYLAAIVGHNGAGNQETRLYRHLTIVSTLVLAIATVTRTLQPMSQVTPHVESHPGMCIS